MNILFGELTIRGFYVGTYEKENGTAFNELVPLVKKVRKKK
jgi:hypothetical protein